MYVKTAAKKNPISGLHRSNKTYQCLQKSKKEMGFFCADRKDLAFSKITEITHKLTHIIT